MGAAGAVEAMIARDKLLCGSWFLIPKEADWSNFEASHTKRMLLGLEVCRSSPATLTRLRNRGCSIIMRFSDEQFLQMRTAELISYVLDTRMHCQVDAVIMWNEGQAGYRMDYASPSWGNNPDDQYHNPGGKLLAYRSKIGLFTQAYNETFPVIYGSHGEKIGRKGPALVAGAPPCLTTGPTRKPWPGLMAWNRVLYNSLSDCDGWAAHLYAENYHGPVDMERLQYSAQIACSLGNPPYYIDEIGILHKDPERAQVEAYIDFCRWLQNPTAQEPGGVGSLVSCVIPFVWAGDPRGGQAWPASYLLTDPQSYALMGQYIEKG